MNNTEERLLPPGSMGLPIVGETLEFIFKGSEYFAQKFKEYGNIFKCHILGNPTVRVTGADNIHTLVGKEPKQLTMKWPKVVMALMGEKSLPVVVGPEHGPLKADLLKAFTPTRLADYFPCVQQHLDEHIQKWMDEGERKNKFLGYPACEDLIGDIMLELVIGCSKEDDKDGKMRQAFKDINHNIFSVPVRIPFCGFDKGLKARQVILDFVKSRVPDKSREKEHISMMDVLLSVHGQKDGVFDEEKVKDNALGLMVASSASLSGALTILILLLGTYPEVLKKVREELSDFGLFGQDDSAELSYDLLQKLEYVHCVMKESFRFMPPVGGCFRKTENEMKLGKYTIPKDWTVVYSIRDTHAATAKLLHEGDTFKPSRWLKQEQGNEVKLNNSSDETIDVSNIADSSSCHYIPFGSGPRMCVGRQLAKMVLCMFIVKLARTTQWDVLNPDCPLVHLPITKPGDDMPVMFKKL